MIASQIFAQNLIRINLVQIRSPALLLADVCDAPQLMICGSYCSKLAGYPNIPAHFGLRLPTRGRNHFSFIISEKMGILSIKENFLPETAK